MVIGDHLVDACVVIGDRLTGMCLVRGDYQMVEMHRLPKDSHPPWICPRCWESDTFPVWGTLVLSSEPRHETRQSRAGPLPELVQLPWRGIQLFLHCWSQTQYVRKLLSLMLLFRFRNTRMKAKPGSTDR